MKLPSQLRGIDENFIPRPLLEDPETSRRARLVVRFAFIGGVFGFCYATFYLCISHFWGAAIIIACDAAMVSVAWVLRNTGRLPLAGNLHALILTLGFCGLTSIEGGVHGHAIAWLASVPLCVLLLVDSRAAAAWCGVCFLATLFFCALEGLGIPVPIRYPARWHSTVTGAGYLGLTIFLSVIGITFEVGRRRAFRGMRNALQDLSQANKKLTQMNAEKNEMLGIAAHDLKNPLNGILGFARLIATKDSALPERVKAGANEIITASTHMRSIVSNLLDIHAIEEGRFPIEIRVCDLAALAGAAVENQEPQAAAKRIAVHFISAAESVLVEGDHRAIVQVLDNLFSNAIKFSPPGKEVFVRLKTSADEARLEVQDQGPGLSAEDHARLFEKFAVLSARPTGGESSTGLGLSIVKRLAEAMEGKVSCASVPGEGATFVLTMKTVSIGDVTGRGDEVTAGGSGLPSEAHTPTVLR